MSTLVLKLALTPALIGAASLAGRRWGPAVSGWLVIPGLTLLILRRPGGRDAQGPR